MEVTMSEIQDRVNRFHRRFSDLEASLARVIVGQKPLLRLTLTALFAGGHCLLEGLPGLGKTLLVRSLAEGLGLDFSRIQFTPDLMPADVTGTFVIEEDEAGRKSYRFRRGPIFANLVLADEINRATPKTQSALLEAMQEARVTVWGESHVIAAPLVVIATQNPIEMEGTYPLPEAQLDRFLFKLSVPRVSSQDLVEIMTRTTGKESVHLEVVMDRDELLEWQSFVREVVIAPHVLSYAARLVSATHPDDPSAPEEIVRYVRCGGSPRAAQAMALGAKVSALLDRRMNVSFGDLRTLAPACLRHRIVTSYEARVDQISTDDLVAKTIAAVPEVEER